MLPAPRTPTLPVVSSWTGHGVKEIFQSRPPRKAKPFAKALHLSGRTSAGIAWTIGIVLSMTPIRILPPMSIGIDVAFAETTAPMKATRGGTVAKYFQSSTSLSLLTMGEKTLCINSGPSGGIMISQPSVAQFELGTGLQMTHPAIEASPRSRVINVMTEPAATTTNTLSHDGEASDKDGDPRSSSQSNMVCFLVLFRVLDLSLESRRMGNPLHAQSSLYGLLLIWDSSFQIRNWSDKGCKPLNNTMANNCNQEKEKAVKEIVREGYPHIAAIKCGWPQ
jgi:hypothetical protein